MMNTTNHLMLETTLKANLQYGFYEGGHMMYIYQPAMVKLREDLLKFYETAANAERRAASPTP